MMYGHSIDRTVVFILGLKLGLPVKSVIISLCYIHGQIGHDGRQAFFLKHAPYDVTSDLVLTSWNPVLKPSKTRVVACPITPGNNPVELLGRLASPYFHYISYSKIRAER